MNDDYPDITVGESFNFLYTMRDDAKNIIDFSTPTSFELILKRLNGITQVIDLDDGSLPITGIVNVDLPITTFDIPGVWRAQLKLVKAGKTTYSAMLTLNVIPKVG